MLRLRASVRSGKRRAGREEVSNADRRLRNRSHLRHETAGRKTDAMLTALARGNRRRALTAGRQYVMVISTVSE
jgi:hypothetical protein